MTPTGPLFHASPNQYAGAFDDLTSLDPSELARGLLEEIRRNGLYSPQGLYFFDKLEAAEDFGRFWVSDGEGTTGFTVWQVQLTSAQRAQLIPDTWFDDEQILSPDEDAYGLDEEFAVYWNDETGAWAAWHGPTVTAVPAAHLLELTLAL